MHAHQRPKLERYDETLFMVLKPVRYAGPAEVVEVGEIMLFVDRSFIISVRHGEAGQLAEARHSVDRQPELARRGPAAVLYAIVDRIVDDYEPVMEGVSSDLQELEAQVFSTERQNPAEQIYQLEREVLDFHRAVVPLVAPLDRLARGGVDFVPEELWTYFRDIEDHLLRVVQQVDAFRELLSSILQVNLTQVNVRQNEDMRKITAWVAILAVPTSIAGIYGMNFDHMPELRWEYGYPLVLVVILAICTVLYTRFRKAGWL
jgi:magnesium transporter